MENLSKGFEMYTPKSYEMAVEILKHLEAKGFFKVSEIENLYAELPELKKILDKGFDEQDQVFKQFLKFRGIE